MVFQKMLNSRKFWYTLAGITIPIVSVKLGVDEATAQNMVYGFVGLVLAQGIADTRK